MRTARLAAAVALALALVGCDMEEPNPAAPSDPAASNASAGPAAGDPGAPATGGGGATTPSPGDPGGGTTTQPDAGTTPAPGGGTTPPPTAAVTVVVNLTQMAYKDAKSGTTQTNIRVGDSVTWKNIDSMDHTTTSDTGLWDTPLAQGASWTRKFATAGSFPYSCMKHKSTMKGTIVVSP